SDEELEAPIEDQPLPADASPTALSPGYIADFDPEEDEEDPEEDPADHPVDGGDNDDNESSDDDDDDDDVVKDEEDEEEEEHLAPADPSAACITEFAAALPSSLPPPPENIKSLKDNIRSSLISLSCGSFDVIVGIDWLSKRKFVIVCHEKVVEIPLEGSRKLRVQGERTLGVAKALMNAKVEFHIDLVHRATSVAKSPYRLAPLEMQELSEQLRELHDKVFELLRKEKLYVKVASEKELILLMVKAADLEISMHGDYYGMLVGSDDRKIWSANPQRSRARDLAVKALGNVVLETYQTQWCNHYHLTNIIDIDARADPKSVMAWGPQSGCSRHMVWKPSTSVNLQRHFDVLMLLWWRSKWRKNHCKDKLGSLMEKGMMVSCWYSLSSKAFRVYNIRTRKVQENLHVGFLENKPMLEGNGPKWLFDLDSLTQSMNYVPVVAGSSSNVSAGTQEALIPAHQGDGIDDQQVNTASPQVNTGSREISTATPEVNTATSKLGWTNSYN
ncbi:hypothetical protein Tco_1386431, partial [Tanacetum coccineum]